MATVTAPKVCIAILNWNNYDQTLACLESLAALDYPNYHIIVVDNASADESVEHIQQAHPDITLICSETNLGYAGGNELALQQALADGETELFWILNNDSTVRPDTLSQLVSTYQQFGDAIYGGVPLSADSTPDHWMLQLTLWDYVPGSRALYPKKIRGTYQQYFPNSEPQVVPVVSGSTVHDSADNRPALRVHGHHVFPVFGRKRLLPAVV